jgi:hypothetical protein
MDLRVVQVRRGLLSYGCRIQDADPVCAFSGGQVRSSVLGVRSSALIRDRVPGPRCQVPRTWNPVPGPVFEKRAHRVCKIKRARIPLTWYLTPFPHFNLYADLMCAFSGGRTRSSVLGVRPSASDWLRCRVPGPRCQIAGTRHLVPGTCLRKTRTRGMQDRSDGVRGDE